MINKKFLHFLIDDADEDVKHSQISDKQSHYEAIELYIRMLQISFDEEEGNNSEMKNGFEGKSTDKGEKSEQKSNQKNSEMK